jgi:eukaryotic translation initiation factor 2C
MMMNEAETLGLACRCTRSVSLVPAAYYAHLAAFRGRALLAPDDDSDKASSCSGTTGGGGMMTIAKVHDNLKTTMFYT